MIVWYEKALKDLQSLPRDVQKRIKSAVEKLPRGDVKPLAGSFKGAYRLRVGQWRVLFFFRGKDIVIFRVKHRKEAYR
ncbi:MAG: type II toxin-antitoxin system RelE/ParE family toxin [Desulfurococcales archaeon]|nr:type II toxin-antitoxin system RelE/ParE family toxin [Desulfurococcales archaeon]